jgi:hypothetical protein
MNAKSSLDSSVFRKSGLREQEGKTGPFLGQVPVGMGRI